MSFRILLCISLTSDKTQVQVLGINSVSENSDTQSIKVRGGGEKKKRGVKWFIIGFFQIASLSDNFKNFRDFPGCAVVKNPPANAGDTGSSPGLGRSHMPRSN